MSLKQHFINVVKKAQHDEFCHQKLMKQVEKSFDVSNLELFLNVYSKTLYKLYFTDFADKNHFVARGLEFLAKLAVKITLNCVEPLDVTNPNGTVSRVYDITTDPFFTHLLKCSLKYSSVEKTEIRFNTCYFVQTLLQNIGNNVEMDNSLCNSILESLLELLHDPKVNVRLQALKALVRLQEPGNPECVVLKSFMLLFTDVNSEVRKAVVKHIAPHPQSYAKIRERLTDTDVGVRQAAYTKWADINPRLFLKIVDRNFILTCAFSDSNKKIQNILNEKLLPKWLISYGGNHLDLLKALKLDADENDLKNFENLCVQVMNVFLKSNSLSEILKHLPVNKENKLIPVKQLHLESVLYWLILISYLRKIEDGEDYLEKILPELTPFSNYIERIIKEKSASSMDEWENLEYQNIVYHLFRIASGFDMSDEVGRRTFYSIILQILTTHKFQQKVIDEIISVASLLNHNIDTFTTDLCQVISEIREPLVDEVPSESEVRARNFEMSKIKVKIQALEMAEEEASKNKDFQHANIIHLELVECQRQLENLKNLSSDKVRVSKDDPETLCRCLDMLIGVLKMGKIKSMTPALRTCKDEFLMPILGCNVSEVHWRFISCLGLFSLMDEETAFTHANLISLPIATYKAVPNYDKAALKTSVACVTDLIRVYGVKVVGIEEPDSDMALEQTQSTTRRKLYSQDMEELRVVSKDDISIEFIIDIILDMLDDEDEDVRFTAVSSIARLMADNFPVNPELISRLILKWFNPLTERKDTMLQQQVGVIIKCFLDNSKGAKKILEKSVMSIISSIANAPISSPLVEVDIDNVLRFLSALTNSQDSIESENIHNSLAFSIIEKISNKPNDVCTPPLAKLLTYLEVQFEDPVSKRNLISSAELLLMDVIDKGPNRNIFKFIKKLKNEENIELNSVNATQNTTGQTLNNRTNPPEGNTGENSTALDASGRPRNSVLNSSLPNNKSQESLEPKRTLYRPNPEDENISGEGDLEDSNKTDDSSESESDSEEESVELEKADTKTIKSKTRTSARASKQLSMMQIRRKSFKPFKKPLKVISEEKSEELENEKVSKKKVPEKVVQKARGNGKLKDRKLSENSEDLIDKGNGVFVKCDYTSMKEARVTNNVQKNNSPNEEKEIQESEVTIKNSSGKINASAKTSTKNSAKEVEIKSKNIVENKIQQENQIDKKHSKKKPSRASAENIADNLNQSASERPLRSRKVEIISQIVLENSKSTEVKLPGKSANTSDTTKMKSAKIQENPTKSSASLTKPTRKKGETVKKVSNVKITASGKSSSNTNENRLRSSPRVSVPPRKLDDYHTPLKGEKNGLGGTVQKQTSFMKRQANTPLSAIGKRSSKRTLFAGRTPRRPSKTPTVLFSPKKKVSRGSIRKSTNKYSEVVLSKKRRSESPVSLLKDRPNKIPKTSSEQKSTRQKSELISEQSDNNSRASTDEKSNRKIKSMRVNRNLNKMQPRFSATKNTHSERRKNLRRSVMAWKKLNEKESNTELSKTNLDKSKQSTTSDESEEESISEKNVVEKKKLRESKELRVSKSRSKQFGEKQESLKKNSHTHSERRKNLRRSVMAWRKLNEKERNTELSKTNSDKSKQSTASDESEEESISEKNVIEKKKLKETKELRISKSRSKQFGEKQESLRKNSQKSHTIKKEKSRRNRDLKTNVEEESDNSYSKEERSMKKHELRHTVHRESSSKDKTSKRLVKTKVDTKKKYRETKKSEEQISISSSEEKDNSKQKREANNISVREVLSLNRVQVSNKKVARNMSPKTLRSDKNSKSDCDLKRGNGVLRSLNSTLNKIDSLTVTPMNRSKNISKTSINNILNGLSKSVSKRCGDLSMKESTPHTTVTRSQRLNGKLKSIENKSSRKRLEMSSSEDETILKTFLQGDEELQILEETLIEDVTSRSNSSGCSKKENLSINSSTSSGSYNKIRRNVRRRTRPKDTSPTNSGSPRRKILRTSQNRILRSVAH